MKEYLINAVDSLPRTTWGDPDLTRNIAYTTLGVMLAYLIMNVGRPFVSYSYRWMKNYMERRNV